MTINHPRQFHALLPNYQILIRTHISDKSNQKLKNSKTY